MKVISNRIVEIEAPNPVLQISGLKLSVSITRPGTECAQVVICDSKYTFTNMVCIMHMNQTSTATVLVDDHGAQPQVQTEMMDEEESSMASDLAKVIGQKVCKKAGLKQLFFSLNIEQGTAKQYQSNINLMMNTEKRVTELLKSMEEIET